MSRAIPSTGALIFVSIKPLIRILIPGGVGFVLTKRNIFPAAGPRITSMLIMNCTLPALLFSKIVPSFSGDNISSLSSLILTGFFYQGCNLASAILVRSVCQTPSKFRYGFVSAFTFSNWGDLPTAVSQAITSSAPFNGIVDENLAIAYVAIFILVGYISMFPLQGLMMVKMDYTSTIGPEVEKACEEGVLWRKVLNRLRRGKPMAWELARDTGKDKDAYLDTTTAKGASSEGERSDQPPALAKSPSRNASKSNERICEEIAEIRAFNAQIRPTTSRTDDPFPCSTPTPSLTPSTHSTHPSALVRVLQSILSFFKSLVSPPTVALLLALIIAVVPVLKALFIAPADGATFHPVAPDGNPPLQILYDTANFVGAASVPLGLLVLGASLGRMVIPRPISRLPIASIISMAVIRIAVLPIIGFFFVQGLVKHTGMVDKENRVLQFVLIYMAGVPTSTAQIAYTQIFGPENGANNADLLAAYLIAQYCVFCVSSVVLTAVTLNHIF